MSKAGQRRKNKSASIRKFHLWQSYLVLALLFITMFSFGGVEPFSVPIALIFTGAAMVLLGVGQWRGFNAARIGLMGYAAIALFLWVIGWGYFQTLPAAPQAWHHPAWQSLSDFLERGVAGRIGVEPFGARRELQWYLVYAAIFITSASLARSKTATKHMVYGFLGLQLFFGLFSFVVLGSALESGLGIFRRGYSSELTSTLINKNSYAGFVGMGLCFSVAALMASLKSATPRRRGQSFLSWITVQDTVKQTAIFAGLSMFFMLLLVGSGSRAGMGTSLAGAGAIVLATQWRRITWRKAAIGGAGIAAVLFLLSSTDFLQRIQPEELGTSVVLRHEIFGLSTRALAQRPILGVGLSGYSQVITKFMEEQDVSSRVLLSAHNTYLEVLIELGIIGALPLFCLILGLSLYALYPSKQPYGLVQIGFFGIFVQLALHSMVDFTLEIPSNFIAAAMLGGGACGQRYFAKRNSALGTASPKPEVQNA